MIKRLILQTLTEQRPELSTVVVFGRDGVEGPELFLASPTRWLAVAIQPTGSTRDLVLEDDGVRMEILFRSVEPEPLFVPWDSVVRIECREVGLVCLFEVLETPPNVN